jgi:hypothetical protein
MKKNLTCIMIFLLVISCRIGEKSAEVPEQLYLIPGDVDTRWSSPENIHAKKGNACINNDGRKRSESFPVPAGSSRVLLDLSETSGTIRRIWITINDRTPQMLRGLKLQVFWDGASRPAISCPLGDFFSVGLGKMATFQSALFACPEGKSFNCYVPMPFRKGAKFIVTNESSTDLSMFYFDIDFTIGEKHSKDMAYFHAYWHRQNPTKPIYDYEILPQVNGRGRFLGCNLGVIVDTVTYFRSWWGEGEVKIYLDGDTKYPTLCGTGTEDYIGSGWAVGQYANLYQGCTLAGKNKVCFYRLHIPDPVWFHENLRVTIQQLGWGDIKTLERLIDSGLKLMHGDSLIDIAALVKGKKDGSLFERQDDWSGCAWFYLDSPVHSLPETAPFETRIRGLN